MAKYFIKPEMKYKVGLITALSLIPLQLIWTIWIYLQISEYREPMNCEIHTFYIVNIVNSLMFGGYSFGLIKKKVDFASSSFALYCMWQVISLLAIGTLISFRCKLIELPLVPFLAFPVGFVWALLPLKLGIKSIRQLSLEDAKNICIKDQ